MTKECALLIRLAETVDGMADVLDDGRGDVKATLAAMRLLAALRSASAVLHDAASFDRDELDRLHKQRCGDGHKST